MSDKVLKALEFCKKAHEGQFRRDGKTPYYTHPLAVSTMCATEDEKVLALLHDVLEDTDVTKEEIVEEFGDDMAVWVQTLTKEKGQSHSNYIEVVSWWRITIRVKIYDMLHNLRGEPTDKTKKRYLTDIAFLVSRL